MVYMGIDPGKKGAVASIWDEAYMETLVTPWDEEDFVKTMRYLAETGQQKDVICCLEHVSAMPGQGVTSMFSFGTSFGFIQGVLKACRIPYELVRPQKWKKEFSITGDKNTAIAVCQRLFPEVNLILPRCRKPHDGMAEALLMAEYARRKLRVYRGAHDE